MKLVYECVFKTKRIFIGAKLLFSMFSIFIAVLRLYYYIEHC